VIGVSEKDLRAHLAQLTGNQRFHAPWVPTGMTRSVDDPVVGVKLPRRAFDSESAFKSSNMSGGNPCHACEVAKQIKSRVPLGGTRREGELYRLSASRRALGDPLPVDAVRNRNLSSVTPAAHDRDLGFGIFPLVDSEWPSAKAIRQHCYDMCRPNDPLRLPMSPRKPRR